MTTSKNANQQTSNRQHEVLRGVSAVEGSQQAQFVDQVNAEESYELLPSGD